MCKLLRCCLAPLSPTGFNNQPLKIAMDGSGHSERPGTGRRPSSPSSGTPTGAKGQVAQSGQKLKEKISPFHNSPIVSRDGAVRSKRPGAASGNLPASPGILFQNTPGRLTAPFVRERPAAAAGSSWEHAPSSVSSLASIVAKAQASPLVKIDVYSYDSAKFVPLKTSRAAMINQLVDHNDMHNNF